MEQKQSITIKQPILKMLRHISIVLSVGFLNTIYGIAILFIHCCGDKEVRNNVISFCFIITQFYTG